MKVRTKPIPKKSLHNDSETITSSHTHRRFLGVQHACLEKPLMILLQNGNTQEILDWTLLRLITVTFQQRSVCSTRSWKFKVLVSHRSGAVAALEGPKDVTEHMVRFVCDTLETWSFGVCVSSSVKTSWQRSLCRMLLSGQGNSRRVRETRRGSRMAVWVTVNQPSKRWRNRCVHRCFKCTLITTASVTRFLRSCRDDLMNTGSRSEVRLVQPQRFGESHVMNSGIWRVSKLCW